MAAAKGKFAVPTVEDLEIANAPPRISLFQKHRDTSSDLKAPNINVNTSKMRVEAVDNTRSVETGEEHVSPSTDRQPIESDCSTATSVKTSKEDGGTQESGKVELGKNFGETFAFLKDTRHYSETTAEIDELRAKISEKGKSASASGTGAASKIKSNAILVNPRQKGNPILKHVKSVPWEFADIVPDYELGQTVSALFLSLRYHHLNPGYIHGRLKQLGQRYGLRILLVQVDVKDPHRSIQELCKVAVMANCTLMLAWSTEEAGRYLETYKVYENKPPDALQGQSEGDYLSRLTDCLTTLKGVNRTDVVTLNSTFGNLAGISQASTQDLSLLPGFGQLKARRLHELMHEPFLATKRRKEEETDGDTKSD